MRMANLRKTKEFSVNFFAIKISGLNYNAKFAKIKKLYGSRIFGIA